MFVGAHALHHGHPDQVLGLIVVNAASSKSLGEVTATLFVTGVVFWIAHVYANILERRVSLRRRLTRHEVRTEFVSEWPLVSVGALPVMLLIAGELVGAARSATLWVITGVCLVELAVVGIVIGRRSGYGWRETALVAASNVAMGLVIASLKVLVH